MSDVVALPAGLHASIRQIAEETGFDRDTVARKISEQSIVPSGKRGGHPIYRLREVLPALYVMGPDGRMDPNKMDPFRRKAHYQAEREALEFQVARREVIPRIEVEQEQARIFKVMAQACDTLPDVLERDCGLTRAQVTRVEEVVNQARERMYAELTEQTEEDDAGPVRSSG